MPFQSPDPSLDREYEELVRAAERGLNQDWLRERANDLALRIRSRCIDLATWQAEYSSEYKTRESQCRMLTGYAGSSAHPLLAEEFGKSR